MTDPIERCEYGKYCLCATCHYQEDCADCADCTEAQEQMHDIWTCTKYMRKERLRKEAAVKIVSNGNCPICHKHLKGSRLFLCEECSEKVSRTRSWR